jgi:hypothetical protein
VDAGLTGHGPRDVYPGAMPSRAAEDLIRRRGLSARVGMSALEAHAGMPTPPERT